MKLPKYYMLLFVLLALVFIMNCSVLEPEAEKGSLVIQFDTKSNTMDPDEILTSVRCKLTKGDKSVQNKIYAIGDSLSQIEITGLKADKGYIVELFGRNVYGCITSRAYESDVEISSGRATTIEVTWENNLERGTVTDVDGTVYATVKIGDQWWMAENLKVSHYRNGDPIPLVEGAAAWDSLDTGAWCAYDNNQDYIKTYGRLYNWYAVDDPRGLAPEGWHVPSDEEWMQLELTLGMLPLMLDQWGYRGNTEGDKLKSIGSQRLGTGLWIEENAGATNESCFTALPGGWRIYTGAYFSLDYGASFWSSTEFGDVRAWSRSLTYRLSNVLRSYGFKGRGFSIRCVKDTSAEF